MVNAAELRSRIVGGFFCHLCFFCSIATCIFPDNVMFIHLSYSEFQGSQGRGAVFSEIQEKTWQELWEYDVQDAVLHRPKSRFYTRVNLCSALWLR